MSTRSGEFVTLRQLREEVGKDACRYFYVMRKAEQHMDFDLELAKSNSKDNPVYYIQYAHARICRVLDKMQAEKLKQDEQLGLTSLELLTNDHEKQLMTQLSRFSDIVMKAAEQLEPHLLANYLKDLATDLHAYYDASGKKILVEDDKLRNARICLIKATQYVLQNGLDLLSLSAPEKM
jgi:arginyl-tRNA synthetase